MVKPPPSDRESQRLDALGRKIDATRARHEPPEYEPSNITIVSLAWRLVIEMLAGIAVGGFLGWWLDRWFDSRPWFMLSLLGLGMIAGVVNSMRVIAQMRADQGTTEDK